MVVAMYVGMAVLDMQIGGIAEALGLGDLHATRPQVATLLMAFEMALPMVVWMDHRSHTWRSIAEMAAVTLAPAPILIVTTPTGAMDAYHVAMLVSMFGLMLFRRSEYAKHNHPSERTTAGATGG